MPFWFVNTHATFMRLMDDILEPFTNTFVVVYLDDILFFSQIWEDHLHHIRQGIHVDPSKIQVIRDCPAPTTLTELRSFLELANFYCRLMLGFSNITWPLSQFTKGRVKDKFFWSKTHKKTFSELKNRLYSSPALTLLDPQQPFETEIDAFDYAIGVVLT
eukprot:PITA_01945